MTDSARSGTTGEPRRDAVVLALAARLLQEQRAALVGNLVLAIAVVTFLWNGARVPSLVGWALGLVLVLALGRAPSACSLWEGDGSPRTWWYGAFACSWSPTGWPGGWVQPCWPRGCKCANGR